MDEDRDRQYRSDERWAGIVGSAGAFAVLVACMGLFGQASLSIAHRTKEIGIRKAIGATMEDIIRLLSEDMARLVIGSNVIAWPIAFYAGSQWLDNFAYRMDLSPSLFLVGGLAAGCVAVLTVGWLGFRAAREDPVEALRYE